jgi:hypothetical protein
MLNRSVLSHDFAAYDERFRYAQDYDLWSRIAAKYQTANLPEHLVKMRIRSTSMTATYGQTVDRDLFQIRKRNHELIARTKLEDSAVQSERLHVMWDLLYGGGDRIFLQSACAAAKDIRQLQRHFCEFYGLDHMKQRNHRVEIDRHLSRRLIATAHARFFDRQAEPIRAAALALGFDARSTLNPAFLWLLMKIVLGRGLIRKAQSAFGKETTEIPHA